MKSCYIYRKDINDCFIFDFFGSNLSKMDQTWLNFLTRNGFLAVMACLVSNLKWLSGYKRLFSNESALHLKVLKGLARLWWLKAFRLVYSNIGLSMLMSSQISLMFLSWKETRIPYWSKRKKKCQFCTSEKKIITNIMYHIRSFKEILQNPCPKNRKSNISVTWKEIDYISFLYRSTLHCTRT